MFALADSRLGSDNLNLSTEGRNRERIRGLFATFRSGQRNRVDTGSNRRGVGRITIAPSKCTRNIGVSGQHRAVIFAKDIVTTDRNSSRSRFNRNSSIIR